MDTYIWIGTVLLYTRLRNISGAFEAYCSSQVQKYCYLMTCIYV